MIIYLVHVYDSDDLYDYKAARDLDVALREAARLCVLGDHMGPDPLGREFDPDALASDELEARIRVALDAKIAETCVPRWHVSRGAWLARVDRMEVL